MNDPITGCRGVTIRWFYYIHAFLFNSLVNWTIVTHKTLTLEDVNYYEEWLGPIDEQRREH
jgi:hypothetical protein